MAFDITEGIPGFVTHSNSHWQVIDLGNGTSEVVFTNTTQMKKFMSSIMGPMFRKTINRALNDISSDLKIYVETGKVSENKKERVEKLMAKN